MIVNNLESYEAVLEFIQQNELLAYDIETDGLNPRKNQIIGIGISSAMDGFYLPLMAWNGQSLEYIGLPKPLISKLLTMLSHKKLITWNGSFDIPFTKNNLGVDLLDALYADGMLLKHTCDEEFPFGLKEVSAKLFGHDVTEEKEAMLQSIKEAGGSAKEYYKASTKTLAKYCVQDCLLTFKCFNYYSKKLRESGLEDFYYNAEVMPLYKNVTIPMEQAGVGLAVDKLQKTQSELKTELAKLESNIQTAIEPHLSAIFRPWFLNKDYPLKTTTGKMPAWAKKGLTQQQAFEADYPGEYMFNLQSKHHLKKLFFDTLHEEPLSRTPTGQPQVDEDFLDSVAPKYAWVRDLIIYNKLNKILSTYVERFLQETENGIYYPSYLQHRTVSGRFSSDFQQLPRPLESKGENDLVAKYTSIVRGFFISRPGFSFVDADYEQLEPSIFAHNSGDRGLISIFNNGLDFYSEIAIKTEKLTGYSSDKTAPNYLGKLNKPLRQKAKSYSLGIAYGMSGYKLKFEINCTEQEADQLVNDYLNAFPKLKETMHALQESARTKGFVVSQAGRMRRMPAAVRLFNTYGPKLSNGLELWKAYHEVPSLYAKAKEDSKTYKNLMNNALNFPIQSLAASIVNRACIKLAKTFKNTGLQAIIVGQVHDEVLVECPDSEISQVKAIMKDCLENVVKLSVPLRAEPISGKNYGTVK